MPLSSGEKGAIVGGGIGTVGGLLLGGGLGAVAGGLGGAAIGGILGGRKNPNPEIPTHIAGRPTPSDLYDFLALLPSDPEKYFYLKNEDALPPYVFFPINNSYLTIERSRGKASKHKSCGNFLSSNILGQLSYLLHDKYLKAKYLNMIVYVLLRLELYFDEFYSESEIRRLIRNIPVTGSKGLLYEQLEMKIVAAVANFLNQLDGEVIPYLAIIAAFTKNPYLAELATIIEAIN